MARTGTQGTVMGLCVGNPLGSNSRGPTISIQPTEDRDEAAKSVLPNRRPALRAMAAPLLFSQGAFRCRRRESEGRRMGRSPFRRTMRRPGDSWETGRPGTASGTPYVAPDAARHSPAYFIATGRPRTSEAPKCKPRSPSYRTPARIVPSSATGHTVIASRPCGAGPPLPQTARQTYFVSRYSSMPRCEPSRPMPDCLTPPNGASSVEMMPVFTPTIPYSSASETRCTRPTSRA